MAGEYNINKLNPESGRRVKEDGSAANIADIAEQVAARLDRGVGTNRATGAIALSTVPVEMYVGAQRPTVRKGLVWYNNSNVNMGTGPAGVDIGTGFITPPGSPDGEIFEDKNIYVPVYGYVTSGTGEARLKQW